jgi:hypothetical protein
MSQGARMQPTTAAPPGAWKSPGTRFAIVPEPVLRAGLPGSELRVLLALAMHARPDTGWCALNRGTLADATGMGAKEVSIATSSLVAKGWLHKMRRGRRCNEYYLRIPPAPASPGRAAGPDDARAGEGCSADRSPGAARDVSPLNLRDMVPTAR